MTYVIAQPCIGTCDTACVPVCPVECIYPEDGYPEGEDKSRKQLYIHPDECISCGACEPECPVEAIFDEDDLPSKWQKWIEINAQYFDDPKVTVEDRWDELVADGVVG